MSLPERCQELLEIIYLVYKHFPYIRIPYQLPPLHEFHNLCLGNDILSLLYCVLGRFKRLMLNKPQSV